MLGQGYCAATDSPGDCGGSTRTSLATASGYWKASRHKIHSLRDCKRHCFSDCPACVFVSISKRNDDCSWYTTCPTPLQQAYGGQTYATAQVRNRSLGSKRSVLKVTAEDEADSAAVAARFPARPPVRATRYPYMYRPAPVRVPTEGASRPTMLSLDEFVDLAPWVDEFRNSSSWRELRYSTREWRTPRCNSGTSTDCEAVDALTMLFWKHEGGVSLELGGLDGVRKSETLMLSEVASFRRIVVDVGPEYRRKRRMLQPPVVGAAAAICSSPGRVHFISHAYANLVSGIVEYMPPPFLRRWYPQINQEVRKQQRADLDWDLILKRTNTSARLLPCTPLTRILDHIGIHQIHFAILDTEGSELDILRTLDWGRIRFGVLVVEVWSPTRSRPAAYRDEVLSFIRKASHGQYRVIFPDHTRGRNLWLMHRDFHAHALTARPEGSGYHAWQAVEE